MLVVSGGGAFWPFLMFFFPPLFLLGSNVLFLGARKRLVSTEGEVLCALDTEGIWEGATVESFLCLLHPFPFLILPFKESPRGGSSEPQLCSLLGDFVYWPTAGLSVPFCPSVRSNLLLSFVLSSYLLEALVLL